MFKWKPPETAWTFEMAENIKEIGNKMLQSIADGLIDLHVLALSLSFISDRHVLLMKSACLYTKNVLIRTVDKVRFFWRSWKVLSISVLITKAQSLAETGFDTNWGWQKLSFIWLNCLENVEVILNFRRLRYRVSSFLKEWCKDKLSIISLVEISRQPTIFRGEKVCIRYALEIFVLLHYIHRDPEVCDLTILF